MKLLQLKFGPLGARERAVIDAADLASLGRFAARVLTAATLDDVL